MPLVLDLDGVLRLWDPSIIQDAERDHGLPDGALRDAILSDRELLGRATTGVISDAEWRSSIGERLAGRYGSAASGAVAAWSESRGAVDAEVLEIVRQQRRLRTVVVLSNATDRLQADLEALQLTHELDAIISSASLGVAKPDHRVFTITCERLGVTPGCCLFVDDDASNVRAASAVGLRTHQFRTPSALEQFLTRFSE